MAFFIFEMFSSFEIDRMPKVFSLFKNLNDCRTSPIVNILEHLVFVNAFSVMSKIS